MRSQRGARRIALVFGLAAFAFCYLLAAPLLASDSEPPSPAARLYEAPQDFDIDIKTPLKHKDKLEPVPEDTLDHKFKGDALITNNKLAVLVTGVEVDIYASVGPYWLPAATILPTGLSYKDLKTNEVRVVENSAAAVALEGRWESRDGAAKTIRYRLAAGQPIVEVKPVKGTQRVAIWDEPEFVVTPEFFGDDIVLPGFASRPPTRTRLPAENCFLSLSQSGLEMMMCVRPSNRSGAYHMSDCGGAHFEIECEAGKPIWLAFLGEVDGIWHEQPLSKGPRSPNPRDWKPPFPAKWRANVVGDGLPPRSWFLDGKFPSPPAPLPQGERGVIAPAPLPKEAEAVITYPIDRDRQTPLDVFTPMDVLRNTLGVGPCQYILQTEGLTSEDNPTPDNVMTWVEKQFARKKQKKSADEIREMLGRMSAQVAATQARVERYSAAAIGLRKLIGNEELLPAGTTGAMSLQDTLAYMDRSLAEGGGGRAVGHTQQLTSQVAALIDTADAADECRKLGDEARQIGLTQERTLARSRMALRWIRAQAKMAAADKTVDKKTLELAKTVQARTEEILYAK